MAISEPTSQATAQAEETRESPPVGERVAKLEGAYEHLSTKADVESVRTEVEKVRTEVESVWTEVGELRAYTRANRWILTILIGLASLAVAVTNVLVSLALRT